MEIDGLIFDCDGTLADTMGAHYLAWTAVLTRRGLPFSEERFFALAGMPPARIVALLVAETRRNADVDIEKICAERDLTYLENLDRIGPVAPVLALAERHRGVIPMAVASGSVRSTVDRTLDVLGIRDWFTAIVTSENTVRHKPDPDVFLEAARRMGVEPQRCRVYEDADLGLEAARRAGMDAVDVRHLYKPRWYGAS